jgi:hypothetical protein
MTFLNPENPAHAAAADRLQAEPIISPTRARIW